MQAGLLMPGVRFVKKVPKMQRGIMEKRIVQIEKIPVELFKILKFESIAFSGGEAKHMIADGLVFVNGRLETRKRKKIYPGDTIEVMDIHLKIVDGSDS